MKIHGKYERDELRKTNQRPKYKECLGIPFVLKYKYLGIWINDDHSFVDHFKQTKNKILDLQRSAWIYSMQNLKNKAKY